MSFLKLLAEGVGCDPESRRDGSRDDNPRGGRGRGGNLKFSKRPEPEKTPYFRVAGALLFLSFNPWAERITLYTSHRGILCRKRLLPPSRAHVYTSLPLAVSLRVLTRALTRTSTRTRARGGVNVTYETACLDNAWSARCARWFVVLAAATPIERFFFSRGSKYRRKKKKKRNTGTKYGRLPVSVVPSSFPPARSQPFLDGPRSDIVSGKMASRMEPPTRCHLIN